MLKSLFRRNKKPSAMIFVDFEYWCISLDKLYKLSPMIKEYYSEIDAEYSIKRLLFFGDFTNPTLRTHIDTIRDVTNDIIDTQNPSQYIKKDYTDFIMLDYIYQTADQRKDIDTYILFTGDGHFSSVASYLKNRKKKNVKVYAVKGSLSNKLKNSADECIEMPSDKDQNIRYSKMIIENFSYLAGRKSSKQIFPTFRTTVSNVAVHYGVKEEAVQSALQELINNNIIIQKEIQVQFSKKVRILIVDWSKASEAGLLEK